MNVAVATPELSVTALAAVMLPLVAENEIGAPTSATLFESLTTVLMLGARDVTVNGSHALVLPTLFGPTNCSELPSSISA